MPLSIYHPLPGGSPPHRASGACEPRHPPRQGGWRGRSLSGRSFMAGPFGFVPDDNGLAGGGTAHVGIGDREGETPSCGKLPTLCQETLCQTGRIVMGPGLVHDPGTGPRCVFRPVRSAPSGPCSRNIGLPAQQSHRGSRSRHAPDRVRTEGRTATDPALRGKARTGRCDGFAIRRGAPAGIAPETRQRDRFRTAFTASGRVSAPAAAMACQTSAGLAFRPGAIQTVVCRLIPARAIPISTQCCRSRRPRGASVSVRRADPVTTDRPAHSVKGAAKFQGMDCLSGCQAAERAPLGPPGNLSRHPGGEGSGRGCAPVRLRLCGLPEKRAFCPHRTCPRPQAGQKLPQG